jgi:SAM-dependent methyltransferase
MPCPLCRAPGASPAHAEVRDLEHGLATRSSFRTCASCGLVFQDPQPQLSDLLSYYPKDYRPHMSGSTDGLLGWLKGIQSQQLVSRYQRWLPADKDSPILDLGCGSGQFLKALRRRGYTHLTGADRNPALGSYFEGTGIHFLPIDLEPDFHLEARYQTIVLNYVLEHFLDPRHVLARCREALLPGGQILLLTPNADSIGHKLFAGFWSGLHAPRHPQIFTTQALKRLAGELEFAHVETAFVTDPASWAFSFQNWVRSHAETKGPPRGTAWYSLAGLPFWYTPALFEKLAGKSSSMVSALR